MINGCMDNRWVDDGCTDVRFVNEWMDSRWMDE